MFWFRMAFGFSLLGAFLWDLGVVTGILMMCSVGSAQQSMEHDPTKNGTISVYVFILIFQFLLVFSSLFAFVICFRIWRNQFQMDKKLRSQFIMWFVTWIVALLGILAVGIYSIVRSKDPQGQLGFMYEMFQRNSQQQLFVAAFERFQREHSCCGIYGPDDWLMVQLQNQPGASAFSSLDLGVQMNPSTGKCHLLPPTIPVGCGKVLMFTVNKVVRMYAALTIVQLVLGITAGVLAWYCFFYWLEEEVMILPTDELCEIIVVEPPDGSVTDLEEEGLEQEEEYAGSVRESRFSRREGESSRRQNTKSYIHAYLGSDGKTKQRILTTKYPSRATAARSGKTARDPDDNEWRPRIPTQIYMTRSQLNAERTRPDREQLEESRMSVSRKSNRRPSSHTRNRRLDEYNEAIDRRSRRSSPPPQNFGRSRNHPKSVRIRVRDEDDAEDPDSGRTSPQSRHSHPRPRRNLRDDSPPRSESVSNSSIESGQSRQSHGRGLRTRSRTATRESTPRARRAPSRNAREHAHRDHSGSSSRSRSSVASRRHHDYDEATLHPHHSHSHRRQSPGGRGSRSPGEAKVLYKNRNAFDPPDPR